MSSHTSEQSSYSENPLHYKMQESEQSSYSENPLHNIGNQISGDRSIPAHPTLRSSARMADAGAVGVGGGVVRVRGAGCVHERAGKIFASGARKHF